MRSASFRSCMARTLLQFSEDGSDTAPNRKQPHSRNAQHPRKNEQRQQRQMIRRQELGVPLAIKVLHVFVCGRACFSVDSQDGGCFLAVDVFARTRRMCSASNCSSVMGAPTSITDLGGTFNLCRKFSQSQGAALPE